MSDIGQTSSRVLCLVLVFTIASGTLSGCAALSPQKFSDRLTPAISGTITSVAKPTVAEARADAESVQKKYADAIQDLSNITPQISAALIGISATALYKVLTAGSTKAIAALGVGGSALWAYNATLTSPPRQRVYGEGIRALSCAITAASPYDRASMWIDGFETEIRDAALASEQLRDWQDTYAYLLEPEKIPRRTPNLPAACAGERPVCPKDNSGTLAGDQALKECGASLNNWNKNCGAKSGKALTTVAPPAKFTAAMQRARDEQARSVLAVANANALRGTLDVAGQTLMDRSTDIQVKVSGEVLKTEPDPTAVLPTLKNLKQVATLISGSTLTVPTPKTETTAGGAQSGSLIPAALPKADSERAREINDALTDLKGRLDNSYKARVTLESRLAEVNGAVSKVNRTLDQCEFTSPGATVLVVSPSATSIELPLGSSQSFTVSGGSGIPLGSVNAVAGAKLGDFPEPKIDRGTFSFAYKAPADGHVGDQVIVLFTDASHQGTHEVTITAVAAAPATDKPKSKSSSAPATNSPAGGNQQPRADDQPITPPRK